MVEFVDFGSSPDVAPPVQAPPMFEGYPDLLTTKDLAEILGVSINTVRYYLQDGLLPAVKISNRYYTPKPDFVAFVLGGHNG